MEYVFICRKCGNIENINWEKGSRNMKCTQCDESLSWTNAFPPQAAIDFWHTVNSLYELSKKRDKENLNTQINVLKGHGIEIDKTTLDKYVNKYEKILENNVYNDDTIWTHVDNTFEEEILKELDVDLGVSIQSAIICFKRNEYRKAYVIMVASLIEQLFHDYFVELISLNLPSCGKNVFLKKYENAGIQSVIDISDSFLNENLRTKTEKYSKVFFDRWKKLRELRNNLIHNNNKYVSKIKMTKIKSLIEESYTVFMHLKSELYKEINN